MRFFHIVADEAPVEITEAESNALRELNAETQLTAGELDLAHKLRWWERIIRASQGTETIQ